MRIHGIIRNVESKDENHLAIKDVESKDVNQPHYKKGTWRVRIRIRSIIKDVERKDENKNALQGPGQ